MTNITHTDSKFEDNTLRGSLCALVTPFDTTPAQRILPERFASLARYQCDNGTAALVPCGTTGEAPTLDDDESDELIRICISVAKGSGVKVIPGTGSNNTREAVRLTERAAALGADGCLIVVPYYNKPSQEGVLRHFSELNRIGIPLMLYNIPGRTGINVAPDTIRRIADICENLVAVKAANGNLEEISDTCSLLRSRAFSSRPLAILSGDDALTLPILSVGGVGVVSVIANVLPRTTAALVERFAAGDIPAAQTLHHALLPLAQALLRVGPNPEPIKALMSLGGIEVGHGRLPLVPPTPHCLTLLRTAAASTRDALRAAGFAYEELLDRISTDTPSGNQTARKPSSSDVGTRGDREDGNSGPLSFASAV